MSKILNLFLLQLIFISIRFLLDDPQKKMCLVKFLTVEESINAVAFLHGYWLFGRLNLNYLSFLDKFKFLLLDQKYEILIQSYFFSFIVFL